MSLKNNKAIILKPAASRKGYLMVGLYKNRKRIPVNIHRLVAKHFLHNPDNKEQVNHIDGDKTNNLVRNLEWCSCQDNIIHAHNKGLCNPVNGEEVGTSKLTTEKVHKIRKLYLNNVSQHKLAYMFNVSQQMICKIVNNKCWKNI